MVKRKSYKDQMLQEARILDIYGVEADGFKIGDVKYFTKLVFYNIY